MSNSLDAMSKWYALSVYTRQEKAAIAHINSMGVELFFPQRTIRRAWSDRVKKAQIPLFPGYVFIKLALTRAARIELIKRDQIIDIVGKKKIYTDDDIAYSIPEHEIDSIRKVTLQREMLEPVLGLAKGQFVRVVAGPLKGVFGTITQGAHNEKQICVNVTLLGRHIVTTLNLDDVIEVSQDQLAAAG